MKICEPFQAQVYTIPLHGLFERHIQDFSWSICVFDIVVISLGILFYFCYNITRRLFSLIVVILLRISLFCVGPRDGVGLPRKEVQSAMKFVFGPCPESSRKPRIYRCRGRCRYREVIWLFYRGFKVSSGTVKRYRSSGTDFDNSETASPARPENHGFPNYPPLYYHSLRFLLD